MTPKRRKYVVDRIIDGDTFVVTKRKSDSSFTVRIACIDAPEMSNGNCGQAAKDFLTGLMPPGSKVGLEFHDQDRYGRSVCEVYVKSKLVNVGEKLVKKGMAEVYDDYVDQCNEKRLYRLQERAYKRKKGFWGDAFAGNCLFDGSVFDVINDEGKERTSSGSRSNSGSKRTSSSSRSNSGSKYGVTSYTGSRAITCSQISSIDEAYAWLRAGHGYLDGDNDGVPCESLL